MTAPGTGPEGSNISPEGCRLEVRRKWRRCTVWRVACISRYVLAAFVVDIDSVEDDVDDDENDNDLDKNYIAVT